MLFYIHVIKKCVYKMKIAANILNNSHNSGHYIKRVSKILKRLPSLKPELEPGKFFGLESYEKMSAEKTEALFSYFKKLELGFFDFEWNHSGFINNSEALIDLFKELKPDCGCAKVTFCNKCFAGVLHTLGFVRKDGILYILDSLGHNKNVNRNILKFHNALRKAISLNGLNNGLKKIVMNHNTQQLMNELTCNHWSFANIEALIKNIKAGKKINNHGDLDSVLPKDVNKILEEQKQYVLDRHSIYTSQ